MGEVIKNEIRPNRLGHVANRFLTNPIVIWALTGFFTYTIGQVLVATPLSSLLLGRAGIVEFLTETGICGDYSGHADWGIIACMLFLPPYISSSSSSSTAYIGEGGAYKGVSEGV